MMGAIDDTTYLQPQPTHPDFFFTPGLNNAMRGGWMIPGWIASNDLSGESGFL